MRAGSGGGAGEVAEIPGTLGSAQIKMPEVIVRAGDLENTTSHFPARISQAQ